MHAGVGGAEMWVAAAGGLHSHGRALTLGARAGLGAKAVLAPGAPSDRCVTRELLSVLWQIKRNCCFRD